MKVLTLFNDYRGPAGGETHMVSLARDALVRAGIEVVEQYRSSSVLDGSLGSRIAASLTGPYDPWAARALDRVLRRTRPDVVHAHNLYPLWSPSALAACRRRGIPTVFTVHNYGLTCPAIFHLRQGRICDRCVAGSPLACLVHNCCDSVLKSTAYALRSLVARRLDLFRRNVTMFVVLNRFGADWLGAAGYDRKRLAELPNMVTMPVSASDPGAGRSVVFAGRLSPEKGVATLLEAARRLPAIRFEIAGDGPLAAALRAGAPANVRFAGLLDADAMGELYRRARCVVVPSHWFEGCPLVVLEAMAHGVPVVASRLGGLPELVREEETGLLVAARDGAATARAIERLWADPALARRLGAAGRRRAGAEHGEALYVQRLLEIYRRALEIEPRFAAA